MKHLLTLLCLFLLTACTDKSNKQQPLQQQVQQKVFLIDSTSPTVHVFVALCDNTYQGIVPVPKAIGNGQNPATNLYWGCDYGIKTYFSKSKQWKLLKKQKIDSLLLERLVFKHATKDYYLVADAYNGKYIKQCTTDFLSSCAGSMKDTMQVGKAILGIGGYAKLISYIGHDGLMDFRLSDSYNNIDNQPRDCIILACASKQYFTPYIKNAKANPLVWTTNLMCPEAYTLHDALTGYVNKESTEAIRNRSAEAYAKYQKCSIKAAKGLLVSGL
ncbi:MAG: hypothetical protein J0I41_12560 [Filimonas sp.]|nr:hypothetical protein [Filimonas sp.]